MQYLKATNLTKSYTAKAVVDHVNFSIIKGQKIAIVAKNGAGKSTLIRLLMGEIDVTDGTIEWRKNLNIGYLPQESKLDNEKLAREVLFDFDTVQHREHEVELNIIIDKLKIKPYLDQQVKTLSGGETKRVMLAKILASNPEMLVLDEPTNHLDLEMIEWLERYLKKQHATLLMVTHDRYFLERVCTDIYELDRGKIHHYSGNYSYFLEKKAIFEENERIEMHKLKQLFRKELSWIRKSPQGRQTKATFREKRFGDIQDTYDNLKGTISTESMKLELNLEEKRLGGKILKIKNLKKSFGDKVILGDFSHEFRHNEHIGILGKNGVGKSTFINMLLEKEPYDSGLVEAGETVTFGHYEQKDIHFDPTKRLTDIVPNARLLEQFLFPLNQQHQFAETLSGGEKRRLYLLTILQTNPNFLVLDEPTNDLDLVTLGVLEDFLINYKGCLIVVTHDRFFMDRIADHLFVFKGNGVVQDFRGTYSEYKTEGNNQKNTAKTGCMTSAKKPKNDEQEEETHKKLSYMEKRELEQLGKDITSLEKRKDIINQNFNNVDIPFDEIKKLSAELGEVIRQLEQKEYRRFELIERE